MDAHRQGRAHRVDGGVRGSPVTAILAGRAAGTLFVFDLPPAVTLPWTPWLNRGGVVVAPVIQRWCTAPAVIPCEGLVADLIHFAPSGPNPEPITGAALLLDGERAGPVLRGAPGRRFDNRHFLNVDLLPSPEFLAHHGFGHAHFIVRGVRAEEVQGPDLSEIAADLRPYLQRLGADGLSVEVSRYARGAH